MVGVWPLLGSNGSAAGTPITVNDLTTANGGFIEVSWTNATLEPNGLAWRVYVRQAGSTNWILAFEDLDMTQAAYTYRMWNFPTCDSVEIAVAQVTPSVTNGLPSVGELDIIQTVAPTFDHHYWLINPYDESYNIRLEHVRGDSFSEEYEQEVYHLANRGRVEDRGDRLGFQGSLSGQFWDFTQQPLDAHVQTLEFLAHRNGSQYTYLRTPFCWVFPIAIVGFSAQRVAGMGTSYAYLDYDFEYSELEGNNPEYNAAASGIIATVVGTTVSSTVSGYQLSRSIPIFKLADIQLMPEIVNFSGTIVSASISSTSAPVGGSEIWGLSVAGTEFATVELAAGATSTPVQVLSRAIVAGQSLDMYPKSTTASTPSTGTTVSVRIEDQ